ncbi:MAG TPA: hypothetical protein VF699_03955 [Caulobacteraceae bacterium]|jgi:hypothetical protein
MPFVSDNARQVTEDSARGVVLVRESMNPEGVHPFRLNNSAGGSIRFHAEQIGARSLEGPLPPSANERCSWPGVILWGVGSFEDGPFPWGGGWLSKVEAMELIREALQAYGDGHGAVVPALVEVSFDPGT